MSASIYCPGGPTSQSGTAVKERYPDVSIVSCGGITDVVTLLDSERGPFVVPIWNSHEGEVKAAGYVWDMILLQKIVISDVWAKGIEFWYVRRKGENNQYGVIGSVRVAETQCSSFLSQNSKILVKCNLTTDAFDQYREGAEWDGVLVAPGQGEESGYIVDAKNTANSNNFTSFVTIGPPPLVEEGDVWLTGVKMRSFGASLGDAEIDFFDQLLANVEHFDSVPKLNFVFDRDADIGFLLEGSSLSGVDLLDAEQIDSGGVVVVERVGVTRNGYSNELRRLFEEQFKELSSDDFLVHSGVNTCLFICPPLGIYTHGYSFDVVEPVVRFYIGKIFELWAYSGMKCDSEKEAFFEKYAEDWEERGSDFIEFKTISVAAG